MKKHLLFTIVAVLTSLLFSGAEVLAQEDVPRYEVGGQFSLLSRNRPTVQGEEFSQFFDDFDELFPRRVTKLGFGGRFTYNLTNKIAVEAEGNFFPERKEDFGVPHGHIIQCQFGVKTGKRFKKVGFFGKVRPGFVTFTETSHFTGFQAEFAFHPSRGVDVLLDVPQFRTGAATYFSTDIGGVVEFYPSRRIVTRVDVGDTIIRYGEYGEPAAVVCALCCPCVPQLFLRPPETKHNLQISAGIGIRF
jgi:hypothetical protein